MGQKFGNLYRGLRGVVQYRLSPFEQRAFAGVSDMPANGFRRVMEQFPPMIPGIVLFYVVYTWGEAENARLHRKNPEDYINDE